MVKLHELPSTKVEMGVKLPPPPPELITFTNADLFRVANHGLYALNLKKDDYVYSNIEYNDQYPETLNSKQISYLTTLFQGVHDYLDRNPLLDRTAHRITKSLRQKTVRMGQNYKSYYDELNTLDLPESLKKTCTKLIFFVLELVETFHFIDGMITDIRKIPNRPADGNLRVSVHEIIFNFQSEKNTGEFPKFPYLLSALKEKHGNDPKFTLSARQYGHYKTWLKRGTFYWYIQPSKVGIK
jgi:hypothetical protein